MDEVITCFFCGGPITEMSGRGTKSICRHHISYTPEVIVPTHHGCHASDKFKGKPKTKHVPTAKELFIKSLGDTVVCYFCGELITRRNGRKKDSLTIHHINGNDKDNQFENLTPVHRGCHQSHHSKGTKMGDDNPSKRPEVRKKKSKAMGEGGGARRTWEERKRRYGDMGVKDPELFRETQKMVNNDPKKLEIGWNTRRERYGPSGGNDKKSGDPENEWAQKMWKTRREKYGPNGLPKVNGRRKYIRKIGKDNLNM
jgi:hypothetical protein